MKKLKPSLRWLSLPVIMAILPSMLSIQAFTSRCGSVKVSVGVKGWSVEAHKCFLESSSSTTPQASAQALSENKNTE